MDNLVSVRAAQAAAEEHRTLLLREMNHRIKNILAAVQAIANQTFKGQATADSLRVFGSRLSAMATAHDLLVTRNWESAEVRRTIEAALRPSASAARRVQPGRPVGQDHRQGSAGLVHALHEPSTNAAK